MNQIESSIQITVYADQDYKYVVSSGDIIYITYVETNDPSNNSKVEISFGSIEEMEAVANAMLKVVKMSKD